MCITVFKRYELKYILSSDQYDSLLNIIKDNMRADEHGRNSIQSLYYDTDDYLLIRRSIEKPEYKEKLRLRSYGLANEDSLVYLELKKKYESVVYKRRIESRLKDLGIKNNSQIENEIDYFKRFYKNLNPKMLLIYDREAYFKDDLRVTFDHNIRYRENDLSLTSSLEGNPVLKDNRVLLEIKTGTSIPLWLVRRLDKEHLYKTSFSKYGEAYKITKFNLRGGKNYEHI